MRKYVKWQLPKKVTMGTPRIPKTQARDIKDTAKMWRQGSKKKISKNFDISNSDFEKFFCLTN